MKYNIFDYFTYDEKKSTEKILASIKFFGEKLALMQNEQSPCFGKPKKINYYEYLKTKKMNENPANLETVYNEIADLFNGMPDWKNPRTMYNVIPPTNEPALVTSFFADKVNANFSHDEYAGLSATAELEVVKQISDLVGWDWSRSGGIFTFGGKGTILYALRCALVRVDPEGKKRGYKKPYFFITSQKCHPCYAENASWLGIGSNACINIPTDLDGHIDINHARDIIEQNLQKGNVFLGFIATGGTTVELEVDSIQDVVALRDEIVEKHNLSYKPWVHVDSVVGWAWLYFNGYDFKKNPLNICLESLERIRSVNQDISKIVYADSFGIDFHKTGFCPYISSLFILQNRDDFFKLGVQETSLALDELTFGSYAPFEQSLELTRSGKGPISALTTMKLLGKNGYRQLIAQLTDNARMFRNELKKLPYVELLNEYSRGIATLFYFKPSPYKDFTTTEIIGLTQDKIDEIKNYNLEFAEYVKTKYENGEGKFIFTASDVFTIRNTNVVIGMMKAYSLALQISEDKIREIVRDIDALKEEFDNEDKDQQIKRAYRPVDMVYRRQ